MSTDKLDDWDPLKEGYYSVSFNTYNEGPGVNLPLEDLPAFSEKSAVKKLKTLSVKNVPVGLTETGLKHLFNNCGTVLSVQKLQPKPEYPLKTIAFVDFSTTREVLCAIDRLHDKPPFFFQVTIANMSLSDRWKIDAKKQEELDEIRRKVAERHILAEERSVLPPPPIGRGRGLLATPVFDLNTLKQLRVELGNQPGERRVTSSASSSSSSASCKTIIENVANDSIFDDDMDLNVEVVISGNASGETSRIVRIPSKTVDHDRKCTLCKEPSDFRCPTCKVNYCSTECQEKDWPEHRLICKPLTLSQAEHGGRVADRNFGKHSPDSHGKMPPQPKTSPKFVPPLGSRRSQESLAEGDGPALSGLAGKVPPAAKETVGPMLAPVSHKAEHEVLHLTPATLPLGETVEAIFSNCDDLSEVYLQQTSSLPFLEALQAKLQAACPGDGAADHQPTIGALCCAQHSGDGQWYRAKVLSIQPMCTVHFVDYGDSGTPLRMCPLPEGCGSLPAQALRCGLHGVRPVKGSWGDDAMKVLGSLIQASGGAVKVKAHSVTDGMHKIDLSGEGCESLAELLITKGLAVSNATPAATPAATPPAIVPKTVVGRIAAAAATAASAEKKQAALPKSFRMGSVLDSTKEGEVLTLQVTVPGKDKVWAIVLAPETAPLLLQVEEELNRDCPKAAALGQVANPVVGDYVASKSLEDGHWYRAYVFGVSSKERLVRYIDYGNDEVNTAVVPLPESHLAICANAAQLCTPAAASLPVGTALLFTVRSRDRGVLCGTLVCVEDGKEIGLVTLGAWDSGLGLSGQPSQAKSVPVIAEATAAPCVPAAVAPTKTAPAAVTRPLLEAKVLHVEQRQLPSAKRPMSAVWATKDVLFLQQNELKPQLEVMMAQLNEWVQHVPEQPRQYAKGDYVCARFSEDNMWYRGQLMSAQSAEGMFLVMFIDFGNSEAMGASRLRPLSPRFAEQPLFAMCVVPQGVSPTDPRLEGLLLEQPFAAVAVDTFSGIPVVRLVRKDGTCINELLCTAKASPVQSKSAVLPPKEVVEEVPAVIAECPLSQEPTEVVLSAVEGDLLYVQPLSRADALLKVSQLLAAKEGHGSALGKPPVPCQCVAALYSLDQQWYRARVVAVMEAGSKARVQFVDFGNEETVPSNSLRPLSKELVNEPACALAVVLDGVSRLSLEAVEKMPKDPLVMEVLESSSPPRVRLMSAGNCVNALAAAPPERIAEGVLPQHRVKATMVYHTETSLYLRTTVDNQRLTELQQQLASSSATSRAPAKVLEGDCVCALHNGVWERARVVGLAGGVCQLLFVDTGCRSEAVEMAQLRPLPRGAGRTPALAVEVKLDGVTQLKDSLVSPLRGQVFFAERLSDKEDGPPSVRIFNEAGECVSDLFRMMAKKQNAPKKTFPESPLPAGRIPVKVAYISIPEVLFYLQQISRSSELLVLMSKLNMDVPNSPPLLLKPGDAVSARFSDQNWYRGVALSAMSETSSACRVSFVDFGNNEDVRKEDLRMLPAEFRSQPVFAHCVTLEGVQSVGEECATQLTDAEVEVEIIDASSQPPMARLYLGSECLNALIE